MANILGQNGQPKLDLSTSKPILCSECGYDVFLPGTKMRKISKLVAGTDQDVIVPFDILLCGNCGELLEEVIPREIIALEKLDAMKAEKKDEPKSGLIL
jgi:hypothetical protein